jgi:hypothetical protein
MSDDLKGVSVHVYNQWTYRLCLSEDQWKNYRSVDVTYPNGKRMRSHWGVTGRPPADPDSQPCKNYLGPGETLSRTWNISDGYPDLSRKAPFTICYEVSWTWTTKGYEEGTSTACSFIQRGANGQVKVAPLPTKVVR